MNPNIVSLGGGFFNWLMTNNRPCPNQCGQSINKLDGCNRVKCSKCAFECCWVCLESWRKHPMCNRFLDVGNNIELRFIHFYIRYKNHHNSYNIEKGIDFITDRSRYKLCHTHFVFIWQLTFQSFELFLGFPFFLNNIISTYTGSLCIHQVFG